MTPPAPKAPAGVRLARSEEEVRRLVRGYRAAGRTVGLVPTMGALHEGHLSLVDLCRERVERTVLSIFVNPTQFGPDEDLERYPRDLDRDLALAAERGVDAAFAPSVDVVYPVPQTIWIEPGPLGERLCGASRPGHFRGVLTVVLKLFSLVEPDLAVFGRKDYQQAVLIRRMVRELRLPVRIETGPVIREEDGLALSSRNAYLSADQRDAARSLSGALRAARRAFAEGERDPFRLESAARARMEAAGARVEYARVVDPETLVRPERAEGESVCAVAAHVGPTRLIDNAPLAGPSSLLEPDR